MAYLASDTALRLLELRRVMKANATLDLHCDPNSSHYLKILLDCVFEAQGLHKRNQLETHNRKVRLRTRRDPLSSREGRVACLPSRRESRRPYFINNLVRTAKNI